MRIISGEDRGRKIEAPSGMGTRPILDRAKESIFNMLVSLGGVEDLTVFDLYAGSGSFGLECLSRGAKNVHFVENSKHAINTLTKNVETIGYSQRCQIHRMPVAGFLAKQLQVDLVFCDPPYKDDPWEDIFSKFKSEVTLVGHAATEIDLPEGWQELKRRKYGRSHILICINEA